MDLPFSPTLFSKIDIFQQLVEYEKENKPTWDTEKRVLLWTATNGHSHRGTPIGTDHISNNILGSEEVKASLPDTSKAFLNRENGHIILEALNSRGFGTYDGSRLLINQKAFTAGEILHETKMLTSNGKYKNWERIWWWLFYGVVALLILQILNSSIDLVKKFLPEGRNEHQGIGRSFDHPSFR